MFFNRGGNSSKQVSYHETQGIVNGGKSRGGSKPESPVIVERVVPEALHDAVVTRLRGGSVHGAERAVNVERRPAFIGGGGMYLCHAGEQEVEAEKRVVAVRLRERGHALRAPVVELEVGVVLVGGKRWRI